jgi:glutathione transport system permease protein
MASYVARRLLAVVPVVFLVVTAAFFVFQLIPGDAARMYAGEEATQEQVERVREKLGLDRPIWIRYATYWKGLIQGDLGTSICFHLPVTELIKRRFMNTLQLAVIAIITATVFGLTMGTVAAVHRGSIWDYSANLFSLLGISIPVFWLGLLLMLLLSLHLGILPTAGNATWKHYLMPSFTLSVSSMAFITRMTRSSMLEVLGEDYVRTARAKGLAERRVIRFHALRNALLAVVTVVGLRFGYMLGGAVIIESVFAWPGMGSLFITAVNQRDVPLVQGELLIFALSFVLINVVVDIAYSIIDPRIRHE